MMWIKGDRTECRTDITELEWTDNNFYRKPITVASKDATHICNDLNVLMIIHDLFETEERHMTHIKNDEEQPLIERIKAEFYIKVLKDITRKYNDAIRESYENGVLIR